MYTQMSKKMAIMKDISKAGYGLLCFVEAVLQYCVVFKEVKPKKDKVLTLEMEFEIVRSYSFIIFFNSYNWLYFINTVF